MRAMVVDDSRAMRMILGRILRDIGCEVVESGDGREAMSRIVEEGPLDFVLVDWNMPVMNGLEFIRWVRTDPARAALPLVMVTTEVERDNIAMALEAGANEYVMKPFTRDALIWKLQSLGLAT